MVLSVGQRKRRYDCLAMDTEVDHSADRFRHVYFVGCDRASRALSNCVESDALCGGRVTVRTRFGRTLPIAREVSLGMASAADHDLALQAKRTCVARAVLCPAWDTGRIHRQSIASLHLVYSDGHSSPA